MELVALTDIGVGRPDNQDNYWCSRIDINGTEVGVMCLCDGMGGLNKGGLASRIVAESVRDYFRYSVDFEGLVKVVSEANRRIFDIGVEEGSALGTTCTILVCRDGKYNVLHVGDTRCYKMSNDDMLQITVDHSALAKYGITYKENPKLYNKYKSKLTNCIGVRPVVDIDRYEGSYIKGESFLICSDGFWHYLDYGNRLVGNEDLRELINKCIDEGERDNITVGILRV